jgi:hypothetical protein
VRMVDFRTPKDAPPPPPHPAPPGKEWHYYDTFGWVAEDPLQHCDGGDEFWDIAEVGGGLAETIRGDPLGMLGVGHGLHQINKCAPPGS